MKNQLNDGMMQRCNAVDKDNQVSCLLHFYRKARDERFKYHGKNVKDVILHSTSSG